MTTVEPTVTTTYMLSDYYVTFLVTVDDNTYEWIHDLFKYTSVKIEYWKSFVPPDHVMYLIGPLSRMGVENWKNRMDASKAIYSMNVREERRDAIHD